MPNPPENTDQELFELLLQDKESAVVELFKRHYTYVCQSAYRIIPDEALAEDLAQDVFFGLWKRRKNLSIKISIKAYLKRSVINKALNHIRDRKMKFSDLEKMPEIQSSGTGIVQQLEKEELEAIIHEAIDRLPERCRIIFSLSRFEEMSYQEIATELDISIKTVENQISKALKYLRSELEGHRLR